MSILIYQLYKWFRNTRTLQVLIGLGGLGIFYVIARNLGLFMTSWVLQELGTAFFVLVIVIFQGEIRQALYRFSLVRTFFHPSEPASAVSSADLSATFFSLSASRTGALVVFERKDALDE